MPTMISDMVNAPSWRKLSIRNSVSGGTLNSDLLAAVAKSRDRELDEPHNGSESSS
jgi:hypothetical protein